LICFLAGEAMIEKIGAEIDAIADDKHARDQRQREEMEAEISASILAVERSEVACIWAAEAQGEVIDFRADRSPQSLLGVQLIHRPHVNASSTSTGLAFDIVMPGQWR